MGRQGERDRGKERFWRRMLRQWRRSGQSVRAFCAEHGLAEALFYAWRRTIGERDRETRRDAPPSRDHAAHSEAPLFVPVTVAEAAAPIEVVLARGHVVRIAPGFDPATLRQLLAVLDEAPPC
jgi:transposase-like protein